MMKVYSRSKMEMHVWCSARNVIIWHTQIQLNMDLIIIIEGLNVRIYFRNILFWLKFGYYEPRNLTMPPISPTPTELARVCKYCWHWSSVLNKYLHRKKGDFRVIQGWRHQNVVFTSQSHKPNFWQTWFSKILEREIYHFEISYLDEYFAIYFKGAIL